MSKYDLTPEEKKEQSEMKKALSLFNVKVREALKNKDTRDILWKILEDCGVYLDVSPSASLQETHNFLGRRSVGLQVIDLLNEADPNIYVKMIQENRDAGTE